MLVLTRKPGEKIIIDGGITISVTEVSGGRVRIGIEAPPDISILRGELTTDPEAAQFQNQWAAPVAQNEPAAGTVAAQNAAPSQTAPVALLRQPLLQARMRNSLRGLRRTPR